MTHFENRSAASESEQLSMLVSCIVDILVSAFTFLALRDRNICAEESTFNSTSEQSVSCNVEHNIGIIWYVGLGVKYFCLRNNHVLHTLPGSIHKKKHGHISEVSLSVKLRKLECLLINTGKNKFKNVSITG